MVDIIFMWDGHFFALHSHAALSLYHWQIDIKAICDESQRDFKNASLTQNNKEKKNGVGRRWQLKLY